MNRDIILSRDNFHQWTEFTKAKCRTKGVWKYVATKLTGDEYNEDKGEIAMRIIRSYMSEDYRDLINGQDHPFDAMKIIKAEFQLSMPS